MATIQRKTNRTSGTQTVPPTSTSLVVSAQLLNFEPGTYVVELGPQDEYVGPGGFITPCVRIDTLYQAGSNSRAFFSALTDTNFIRPGGAPAFIRIIGAGAASVLLTVYRFDNTAAPQVHVRLLSRDSAGSESADVERKEPAETLANNRETLLLHIEGLGDRLVPLGSWGGTAGSGRTIEGFAILPKPGSPDLKLEYQALLGQDWNTPWFPAGEFCGSRGMMLPLLGVRVRTLGESSKQYSCRYWGSFVGLGELGPFEQGALCTGDGAALEALRVEFVSPDLTTKAPSRKASRTPR